MNTLLQQLSDEINARGYSEKNLNAYLTANEQIICYFDEAITAITAITDEALGAYFKHLSLEEIIKGDHRLKT
jgi:hypothetical protein